MQWQASLWSLLLHRGWLHFQSVSRACRIPLSYNADFSFVAWLSSVGLVLFR